MPAENKNDRSPKDLSVPETMKIAALLAELMPPGAQSTKPVTIPEAEVADDSTGGTFLPPSLEIEDLDDLEPIVPPPIPPVPVEAKATVPGIQPTTANAINPVSVPMRQALAPRITASVVPAAPPTPVAKVEPPRVVVPPPPPLPATPVAKVEPPRMVVPPPPLPPTPVPPPIPKAAPAAETAGDLMGKYNWKGEPPKPAVTPLDPELIPIGNLSADGYFGLVNWRNEKDRERHPRRADYGLDEQTIALARQNPFYVLGQPRRPERATVADVLQEIEW